MAQQHLDRLTALDASFLHQEGPSSHMHIGGVTIFEGPPPDFAELLDHVRGRLHLVPRYRQRLADQPLESGRPVWVDDASFDLEYHVRQTALPSPGDEQQLMALTARVMSQQLDRSKPLWELWVVEGLEGGRFSLISKTHHALIDGVSGVDLATVLFDLGPVPTEIAHPGRAWEPQRPPTSAELVASGSLGLARNALRVAAGAAAALQSPQRAIESAREAVEGLGELAWATLNPAPETPLNVEIGPHRRFVGVRTELEDFKTVKNAFGGTVNDVVLTAVSGALRGWLQARGTRTEGLELRALVPVSIRAHDERGALGNRIAAMRGPLPVYIEDPVARLRAVKAAMDGLKESKQAVGAEVMTSMQQFAPPTVLAQASRLNFSTRLFNLIVTNVPGPQFPLYVRGRELEDIFPVAFLPKGHALAIAIMSYNGRMNFGLLSDFDAMPDVQEVADGIEASLAELVALARGTGAPSPVGGRGTAAGRVSGGAAAARRARSRPAARA
ncbi:wax ester/triacylglycerol synthase family O-acyltransferase [Conexibacter sp. SYSU D00693]|uniref:WS/DGAT/MGAT family O-acyltransferase n=1 Tax=Conexibacter sp. SYSU D00693 TaxID=2812560 RepID=UPI00196A8229|nr:wax ester/triacylglycerol synthase family O-acyltransferase [Conexibacter sp. SYSU D00693]